MHHVFIASLLLEHDERLALQEILTINDTDFRGTKDLVAKSPLFTYVLLRIEPRITLTMVYPAKAFVKKPLPVKVLRDLAQSLRNVWYIGSLSQP